MKRAVCLLALLAAPVAPLPALTIQTAHTRHYDAGDIRPIGDYFSAALKLQGFRSVVASHPEAAGGQYFILKLDDRKGAAAAAARMTWYASDSKDPRTHEWSLAGEKLRRWLYLGLTGPDWPAEDVQPLAWRIEILDGNGAVLAEWKSFLWEMP